MQVSIWNEYIKKLNNRMRRQNRNILLLVDNVLTHALYKTTYLTNITIKYLPPNITSHLQPYDQDIINSFKSQYQKLYLRNRVKAFDKFREFGIEPVEININKCIKYIAYAWNNVTRITIEHCWTKADILPNNDDEDYTNAELEDHNAVGIFERSPRSRDGRSCGNGTYDLSRKYGSTRRHVSATVWGSGAHDGN